MNAVVLLLQYQMVGATRPFEWINQLVFEESIKNQANPRVNVHVSDG